MKPKNHSFKLAFSFLFVLFLGVGFVSAQSASPGTGYYDGNELIRDIAPSTLNIALVDPGTVVTVHTMIPFSNVDGATVSLDGIPIQAYFADNRGYFVAKFDIDQVRSLEVLPMYKVYYLTLEGTYKNGVSFSDTHPITIINIAPKVK